MDRLTIYLISQNTHLQQFFYNWSKEEKVVWNKLVMIEEDDSLFETIFKIRTTSNLYIYDSDFSYNMSSTLFIQKIFSVFPDAKIIIIGEDVIEARALINNHVCPFGYINKKNNWGEIKKTLLFLIFAKYKEKQRK